VLEAGLQERSRKRSRYVDLHESSSPLNESQKRILPATFGEKNACTRGETASNSFPMYAAVAAHKQGHQILRWLVMAMYTSRLL